MSFGWEDVGDTESGWRYGIITGTGTLTELDVYNLLSDSTISSEIISNAGQGNQFGIKVVGYTEFGDRVFAGNYTSIQYLSKLILDNNLTTLGTSLFEGSGIDSITIPSSVTTIQNPSSVFVGLSKIYVDSDNPNYSSGIIKAGGYDYDGILYNEDGNELITYPSGAPMSTITIPEGVTKIGNAAFYSNSSVKTITLASTITELGDYAFEECYMLDEVYGLRSSMTIGSNVFRYTGVKEAFDLAKTISDRSQTTDETNGISISYDPSSQKSQDTTTQTYDVVTTVTKVSNVEYNFGYSTRTGVNTTVTWIWEETVEALGNRDLTGSVTISGTATQGEVLTAITTSLADADGLGTFSYQWKRDGTAISDATSSTYTLTQDDVGKTITVTVSYTDQRGFAESVTSAATSAVANVNDSPTIEYSTDNIGEKDVTIQDLEKNRAQVNVTNYGDAKNDSFKYQWQRSEFKENDNDLVWSNIGNATNEVYTFENSDANQVFRAIVNFTYNDENGTTGSKTLLRIDYFPTVWTNESKQDKTVTVGEEFTFSPKGDDDINDDWTYYLLDSPGWLGFSPGYSKGNTEKDNIPITGSPGEIKGTPTVPGEYTVKIAGGERVFYRMSVLTFKIKVSAVLTQPTIDYENFILLDPFQGTAEELKKNKLKVVVKNYGDAKNDSFKYQWQRSEFKENDNDLVWSNIDNAINEVYTFENSDAKHVFRAVVDFIYNDENGTTGSKTLLRIDYFPTEWTDESKQDKTATLGEDYSYKPVAKELSPSEMYYLLESPDWLDFESSEGKNKSDIPYSDYPLLVGTPTVAGTYNVQIAVVDDGEIYRASVLTFDITVPFKPATTDALQTAIDKWYELANNENDTTANNYEGPEYFGNPKHWDTSLITDLSYVFFKKDQTNHPDISEWDVSNVTSMQGTFSNSTFNGELNKWNVASVTDFSFTFANNIVFNKPLFRWNVQDATTMESMFDNAYSFNQTIEPPMMQNKDGTDFPTELTWDETTINGYLETIYGSATSQTNPTTFNGVFGMIALLKKTYLDNIPEDPNEVGKYNTIKSSFSEVMSELITIQQEILKYNYTYDETDGWTKTSPSIYFTNTDGKTGDEEDDAKNKLNQLRLNTIVDGMLLINKAYDIAKGLGADYSDLISEMKRIYDHVYANLPFYVAWYAPLLTTKANFLNNALTFHNGATDGNIEKKLTDFIATKPKPIKSINDIDYNNTQKQYIVNFSSADLFDNFKAAYTSYSE